MRAVVTGGAGFIGSTLVDALIARGDDVLIIDDLSRGSVDNVRDALDRGAELVEADVRDRTTVHSVLARFRPDAVHHLAAQIDVRRSMTDPQHDASVNVLGTLSVLEAAADASVGAVVVCSTGGAIYGDDAPLPTPETRHPAPESPYGLGKLAAENYTRFYARARGLPALVLRFANVYGPRQHPSGGAGVVSLFCDAALRGDTPVIFGDGEQTRDFLFVGDVARAALAASDALGAGRLAGRVYNVGTGSQVSIGELAAAVGRVAGTEPGRFLPRHEPARPGEIRHSCLDPALGRTELGLPGPTPLDEGLARTWAWHAAVAAPVAR